MQIIVIIASSKEIAKLESNKLLKNSNIVLLSDNDNIEAIIQEYMPKYIILSENYSNYDEIKNYITNNTDSRLIIAGQYAKGDGEIRVSEISDSQEIRRVLDIIEKINKDGKKYKVINQKVISIYSVQGGVGRTSLAFNLAYYLGRTEKIKVLLVDLNFCEGQADLARWLNVPLIPNMSIFVDGLKDSQKSLKKSIYRLNKLNIDILQPPLSISQSDGFSLDMLYEIIFSGRKEYDYIVCDLPNNYENHVLEALNLSTIILLVMTPDEGAVGRANKLTKFLGHDQKKFAVLNKVDNIHSHKSYYKDNMEIPVCAEIPLIHRGKKLFGFLDLQPEICTLREMIV